MKRSYILFVLVIHVAVLQGIYYYPRLPETVATHYNSAGVPDRWLARPIFILARIVLTVFTSLLFGVAPLALAKLPTAWVKLPRNDYWLAPARRGETFRMIHKRLIELGTATLILLIAVFQLVIYANLVHVHSFPVGLFRIFVAIYLVFGLVWATRFYVVLTQTRGHETTEKG